MMMEEEIKEMEKRNNKIKEAGEVAEEEMVEEEIKVEEIS